MTRPLFDESKCIVCGCTDSRACEEGCEWVSTAPPVCSSCVRDWMFAKLWAFVFAVEGGAKGELAKVIREVRKLYDLVDGDRYGVPTLRKVCQINRNERKWMEKNAPPPRRKKVRA